MVRAAPAPPLRTVETLRTAPHVDATRRNATVRSASDCRMSEPVDASASSAQDTEALRTPYAAATKPPTPTRAPASSRGTAASRNPRRTRRPARQSPTRAHEPVASPRSPEEPRADTPPLAGASLADARRVNCERCRLCERRTNTVFGVGDREADWMLIGEAPGEDEDKLGEPFVGQAGKLLDNMLARRRPRARRERLYRERDQVPAAGQPQSRSPRKSRSASRICSARSRSSTEADRRAGPLRRADACSKTDASIAWLRGRVHQYEGVPVIVTYHPAYLLRSLPDKAKAWADLCLAQKTYREVARCAGSRAGRQLMEPARERIVSSTPTATSRSAISRGCCSRPTCCGEPRGRTARHSVRNTVRTRRHARLARRARPRSRSAARARAQSETHAARLLRRKSASNIS